MINRRAAHRASPPARSVPAVRRPAAFRPRLRPQAIATGCGLAALLIAWQVLATHMHQVIVASPLETAQALHHLWTSGALLTALQITLTRLLIAVGIGGGLGIGLGLAAGFSPLFRAFLEPLRWVMMAVPAIFIAVLGMLWFGMGSTQVIMLVSVVITPVIYVNTLAGIDTLDPHLLEMGRVYRFSPWQTCGAIILPGIAPDVLAGLTLAMGIGVRAVVIAEVMGAFDGIGHGFNTAWTFLKTPEMFAWIVVSLGMLAALEFGLLRPIRRYVTRWQQP